MKQTHAKQLTAVAVAVAMALATLAQAQEAVEMPETRTQQVLNILEHQFGNESLAEPERPGTAASPGATLAGDENTATVGAPAPDTRTIDQIRQDAFAPALEAARGVSLQEWRSRQEGLSETAQETFEALRKEADRLGKERAMKSEQEKESAELAAESTPDTSKGADDVAELQVDKPMDVREMSFVGAEPAQGTMTPEDTDLRTHRADVHDRAVQAALDVPVTFDAPVMVTDVKSHMSRGDRTTAEAEITELFDRVYQFGEKLDGLSVRIEKLQLDVTDARARCGDLAAHLDALQETAVALRQKLNAMAESR